MVGLFQKQKQQKSTTHTLKKKKKTDLPALENSCHFPRGKHGPAKKKKKSLKREPVHLPCLDNLICL